MKTGKTTLAVYLAGTISPGIVIWDPRHMVEAAAYAHDAEELEEVIASARWRDGLIAFRPDGLRLKEQFQDMCQVLFNPPDRFRNFVLIVDEAAQLQSPQSIEPYLDVAVRQHPRSVTIIQTTHSLQDWHRASKDLMNDLYCFRLQGRSLQAVVDYCDGDERMEQAIRALPDHHYIHYSFGTGSYAVMSNPALWFNPATSAADEPAPDADGEISVQGVTL